MLQAIHANTGGEYDLNEVFVGRSDACYPEMAAILAKKYPDRDIHFFLSLPEGERRLLFYFLRGKSGAYPTQVAKFLHLSPPVVEKPNVAPIVENVEEPVAEENANVVTDSLPKERKWGKLLTGAGAAVVGAAVGAAVVDKLYCNERFDITVEYKLMVACLNSCGYSEETIDKCGAGIMRWICKDKEKVETIQNRVQSSCSIR